MQLVQFNAKDQTVNSSLDLGEVSDSESRLLEKVLNWMDDKFFSRYNQVVFCRGYEIQRDGDGFPEVIFDYPE